MEQERSFNVLTAPMFDPGIGRHEITLPVGKTIAEIVAQVLPDLTPKDMDHVRVMLVDLRGSMYVGVEAWSKVRPKEGVRVVIRLVPGKSALRSILQIVVAVAAMALGQYWLAPLLGGGAFGMAAGAVLAAGVPSIGTMQVNGFKLQM